jgi:hypothetical protein
VGAILPAVGYWYVVVYRLGDFNHGYGRDTWFQLQVYVSTLAVIAGVIGYGGASFLRPRPGTFAAAVLAGVVFTVCELLLVFLLRRAYPDRDVFVHQLVGALFLGAASIFVSVRRS